MRSEILIIRSLMVRSASSRVSNHEATGLAAILRDARKSALLRMRSELASRSKVFERLGEIEG
jgi:hypothetical protein